MCGIITVAEGWGAIETFDKSRESWLRQFMSLEHGIPSHHTFGDVFALLAAAQIAFSILKQDKSKGSLNSKRFHAALDDNFRLSLSRSFHA